MYRIEKRLPRPYPAWWALPSIASPGVALSLFLPLHFWALGSASRAGSWSFLRWSDQPAVKLAEIVLVLLLQKRTWRAGCGSSPWNSCRSATAGKSLPRVAPGETVIAGLAFLLNLV
jgi:fumarate reductase subunit D